MINQPPHHYHYWNNILSRHPDIMSTAITIEQHTTVNHPNCRGIGAATQEHQHGGYVWQPTNKPPTFITLPIPQNIDRDRHREYEYIYTQFGTCHTFFYRYICEYFYQQPNNLNPSIQAIRQQLNDQHYNNEDINEMINLHAQKLSIYDPLIDPNTPQLLTVLPPLIVTNKPHENAYFINTRSQKSLWLHTKNDQWYPEAIMPHAQS